MKILRILLLLLCTPLNSYALDKPQPSINNQHYQTIVYDPEQVVLLNVAMGYSLTIAFSKDEQIDNIVIGDPGGWQVTPNKRGDHLFISLTNPGVQPTNLTIITNSRTYLFLLTATYGNQNDLPYLVTFKYKDKEQLSNTNNLNNNLPAKAYKLSGKKSLRPISIGDNGINTFLVFAETQDIPAIYSIEENNIERLLDAKMRNGQYVIDGINKQLLFRLGTDTAKATRVEARKGKD